MSRTRSIPEIPLPDRELRFSGEVPKVLLSIHIHMKMIRIWLLTLAALTGLSLNVQAADSFEGRVEMTVTSGKKKKETLPIKYAMKGDKIRMDAQGEKGENGFGGMIFDLGKKEIIILMDHDGEKMFMRQPIKDQMEKGSNKAKDGPAPVATGKTEEILGYQATEYKVENQDKTTTYIWLAKGLGTYFGGSGGGFGGKGAPSPAWEKIAREGNQFPMRVVTVDAKDRERDRMEVTKVDKGSVPDSVFSTDGYKEFKIPGFGGAGGMNPFQGK